jgi:predicted aldo/keto reductase-like oxidoreductase
MNYREFGRTGCKVSALGFGIMRMPKGADGKMDRPRCIAMIRDAIDNGINYIDTAFNYHGGESESVVGEALQNGYREKTYLASKLPVWMVQSEDDFDRLLSTQLERLQTDHIDFYLLHALSLDRWKNTVLKYNLLDKMAQAKRDGRIRHIGFSFHDTNAAFHEILDGYGGWDFCQIQYNYVDTDNQAGQEGLHAAAAKGLGVVIMEPLLGGRLANAPDRVKACLPQDRSPVEAALDFLWTQPEVSLLLSGMSDETQVAENMMYASRAEVGMLPVEEFIKYGKAKAVFDHMALVHCTGCAYCMPCPFGVEIPTVFSCYNRNVADGEKKAWAAYEPVQGKADLCRSCGKCEKVCPQHIEIRKVLADAKDRFAQIEQKMAAQAKK